MKSYNKSQEVKDKFLLSQHLDRNIFIVLKVNQGWSYRQLEEYFKKENKENFPICSFVRIGDIYRKYKNLSIEELEQMRKRRDELIAD